MDTPGQSEPKAHYLTVVHVEIASVRIVEDTYAEYGIAWSPNVGSSALDRNPKVWRRFTEFEQLHDTMKKEGLDLNFPAKEPLRAKISPTLLDENERSIEQFLKDAVEILMKRQGSDAWRQLYQFLGVSTSPIASGSSSDVLDRSMLAQVAPS